MCVWTLSCEGPGITSVTYGRAMWPCSVVDLLVCALRPETLAVGQWFPPGTPVSSTIKTDFIIISPPLDLRQGWNIERIPLVSLDQGIALCNKYMGHPKTQP